MDGWNPRALPNTDRFLDPTRLDNTPSASGTFLQPHIRYVVFACVVQNHPFILASWFKRLVVAPRLVVVVVVVLVVVVRSLRLLVVVDMGKRWFRDEVLEWERVRERE